MITIIFTILNAVILITTTITILTLIKYLLTYWIFFANSYIPLYTQLAIVFGSKTRGEPIQLGLALYTGKDSITTTKQG